MSTPQQRIPLRPDYSAVTRSKGDVINKTVASLLLAKLAVDPHPKTIASERWRGESTLPAVLELVERGYSGPAALGGWGSQLAASALADFFVSMGPSSAGAAMLARGLQFQFENNANIVVPGIVSAAGNASFVGQAAPIPVRSLSVDTVTLSPRKFATISTYTHELLNGSTPSIEAVVRTVLTESCGLALDTALFDASAGDATRPAGLLYNIAAETASTNSSTLEAMCEDVQTLATAVCNISGDHPIILVASGPQAVALRSHPTRVGYQVLSSGALAPSTVIAIASNAICSAVDPTPRFDVSDTAVLHSDTAALAIDSGSSTTPVQAAPIISTWQQDVLSLRMIMKVAWALRSADGIAWINGDAAW